MFTQKNDIIAQMAKCNLIQKVHWNNNYNNFTTTKKKWALEPNVWHIKQSM